MPQNFQRFLLHIILCFLTNFTLATIAQTSNSSGLVGDALLQHLESSMNTMNTRISELEDEVSNLQTELEARSKVRVYYRGVRDNGVWGRTFDAQINPREPLAYVKWDGTPDPLLTFKVDLQIRRACTLIMIANGHIKSDSGSPDSYLTFYVNNQDVGSRISNSYAEGRNEFAYLNHSFRNKEAWFPINFLQSYEFTQEYMDEYMNMRGYAPVTVDLRLQGGGGTYEINGLGMQVISLGCE